MTLENRRNYLDLVEVFKLIKGQTNVDRHKFFEILNDTERRITRNHDCPFNIVKERFNLEIRRNFFSNRVATSWNELPTDLKMIHRLEQFKNALKKQQLK